MRRMALPGYSGEAQCGIRAETSPTNDERRTSPPVATMPLSNVTVEGETSASVPDFNVNAPTTRPLPEKRPSESIHSSWRSSIAMLEKISRNASGDGVLGCSFRERIAGDG